MKITPPKKYILEYVDRIGKDVTYEISATKYEYGDAGNLGEGIIKFYLDNEEIASFPKKDLIIMDKSKVKIIQTKKK